MEDQDSFWHFVIGFLAGGVLGAVAALLLAPQPGTKTRAQVRDKASEVYARAEAQVEAAVGELRTRMDELATKVDEMMAQRKIKLAGDKSQLAPEYIPEEQSTIRVSI